ncbi:MAG: NADH-quinone oxidoreductase subunit H [Thaumarchaeota archaeon]|nr:NADH-quinone oxidoreductase subunit H [Nitrososphaerota archaeon]
MSQQIALLIISSILGAFLTIFLPPLYDGVHRKIKARIHCRVGPPIMQTIYDLGKLMVKDDIVPEGASTIFLYAPYLAFSYILFTSIMVPMIYLRSMIGFTCDLILILYLLSSSTILLALGGLGSGNVFAYEGARRELTMAILTELAVIFSLVSIMIRCGVLRITEIYEKVSTTHPTPSIIIASGTLLACAYIEGFRLPFELPEAEPEISSGIIIEYSGRRLAAFKLSVFMKQFLLVALAVNILEPWSISNPILGPPIFILKTFIIYLIFAILEPLFARFRIQEALKSILTLCGVSIISLILAGLGV